MVPVVEKPDVEAPKRLDSVVVSYTRDLGYVSLTNA
jgi:hypothetical protein